MAFTFADIRRKYFPAEFGEPVSIGTAKHASGHMTELCPFCGEFLKSAGDSRYPGPDDMRCRSCKGHVWWVWNVEKEKYESFGCRGDA